MDQDAGDVCRKCAAELFNKRAFRRALVSTTQQLAGRIIMSWTAAEVSPTCSFCRFACYATQKNPPYPGQETGLPEQEPAMHQLAGKGLELYNAYKETLWNGETRESLDLLKTSHADSSKPMHWMVSTTADDPMRKFITNRPLAENLLCDANHKIISRAISNCIKGHRKCRRAVPTLPTRVLEVLPATNGLSVRLYEPTPGETGTYAALSYCWGGPQPFQTTVDKLEGYKTSIDPARLPRTVMDAAIVTGVLGLRFLWVDSFCIIQDSDDDMSRELSEMHLIYQRAFVTIAAADARTAMAGFLDTVGKPRPPTFKLPCFDRSGKRGSMYLTPCTPIEKQPINQRAWCMVENLLSTRYLVFDAAQRTIELHCREGVFGNGGGQDLMVFKDAQTFLQSTLLPKTRHREMPGGKKPRARKKKREDDSDETSSSSDSSAASSVDQARLDDFWYSLVYSYAGRSLTDPADKLPAFSAVAQSFSQLWGGRYMAGLWERHFPTCLLWRMASNTAESYFDIYNRTRQGKDEFYDRGRKSSIGRRPRNADGQVFARAPSWSWASVDGSIEYGYVNNTSLDDGDSGSDISSSSDSEAAGKRRWARRLTPELRSWEVTPAVPGFVFGAVLDGRVVIEAPCIELPPGFKWLDPWTSSERTDLPGASPAEGGDDDDDDPEDLPDDSRTGEEDDQDDDGEEGDSDGDGDGRGEQTGRQNDGDAAGSVGCDDAKSSSDLDETDSDVDTLDSDWEGKTGIGFLDVPDEGVPQAGDEIACLLLALPLDYFSQETVGLILARKPQDEAWRRIGHFENIKCVRFKDKRRTVAIV